MVKMKYGKFYETDRNKNMWQIFNNIENNQIVNMFIVIN